MEDFSFGVVPIKNEDDQFMFLVIQQVEGHWGFPKGHPLDHEKTIETARRELFEETGIKDVRIDETTHFVEKYSYTYNGRLINKEVTFYPGFVGRDDIVMQVIEIQNYRWADYKTALSLLTYKQTRDILKNVCTYLSKRN